MWETGSGHAMLMYPSCIHLQVGALLSAGCYREDRSNCRSVTKETLSAHYYNKNPTRIGKHIGQIQCLIYLHLAFS
jgi:hypothetical protein